MSKLTVSTSSWHYKLVSTFGCAKQNLCGYFWQVVGLILIFILAVVALGLVFFLPGVLLSPKYFNLISGSFWSVALWSLVVWVVLFGILLSYFLVSDFLSRSKNSTVQKTLSAGGVAANWVKAKKSKVCPMLEFKDKE